MYSFIIGAFYEKKIEKYSRLQKCYFHTPQKKSFRTFRSEAFLILYLLKSIFLFRKNGMSNTPSVEIFDPWKFLLHQVLFADRFMFLYTINGVGKHIGYRQNLYFRALFEVERNRIGKRNFG